MHIEPSMAMYSTLLYPYWTCYGKVSVPFGVSTGILAVMYVACSHQLISDIIARYYEKCLCQILYMDAYVVTWALCLHNPVFEVKGLTPNIMGTHSVPCQYVYSTTAVWENILVHSTVCLFIHSTETAF